MNNSGPWTRDEELELLNHLQARVDNGTQYRIRWLIQHNQVKLVGNRWQWNDDIEARIATDADEFEWGYTAEVMEDSNSERVVIVNGLRQARDALPRLHNSQGVFYASGVVSTAAEVLSDVITKMESLGSSRDESGWMTVLQEVRAFENWIAAKNRCRLLLLQEVRNGITHAIQNRQYPSSVNPVMVFEIIKQALETAGVC
ncbi:MAG: hypothetical protein J3Q66DRAFT_400449 [Benniella sp.]|nr:MAG: hypothetical protein J3Q66DRAFT_400449 [Benniella sp.]